VSSKKSVLVTGGAGYIGSHVVLQLRERGERVVILDNLTTGFRQAAGDTPLVIGDVGDMTLVDRLLAEHDVDTVMHFAARNIVPDSVRQPLVYYHNNTGMTRNLLESCMRGNVRKFVFSSTAAVYGVPEQGVAREEAVPAPISPYGTSKLMSEWMLRDLSAVTDFRHVSLRYCNVAGSDPQGRVGQATAKATLLIKVACEHAVGKRPYVSVFGTDYPTRDGTGVRDYIHVADLARAHVDALEYLRRGGASDVLNCGYGRGYSVLEVLDSVARVSGRTLDVRYEPRREGDLPSLVASASKVRERLGWQPRLDDLDTIVRNTLRWEEKLQREPWSNG